MSAQAAPTQAARAPGAALPRPKRLRSLQWQFGRRPDLQPRPGAAQLVQQLVEDFRAAWLLKGADLQEDGPLLQQPAAGDELLIVSDGQFGCRTATLDGLDEARRNLGLAVHRVRVGDRETLGLLEIGDDLHGVQDWRRHREPAAPGARCGCQRRRAGARQGPDGAVLSECAVGQRRPPPQHYRSATGPGPRR